MYQQNKELVIKNFKPHRQLRFNCQKINQQSVSDYNKYNQTQSKTQKLLKPYLSFFETKFTRKKAMNDLYSQSYEQQEFPAFPVVFQQQAQQNNSSQKSPNKSDNGIFRKFPQRQLNELKQTLLSQPKYDTKYPFLWTEELSKLKVQQFLTQLYKPFNQQFINQMKKDLNGVKISRIGQHKVYIGKIAQNKCNGDCIIIFKNGTVYQGQIVDNKRHGKGVYYDPNMGIFRGFFKNDIKQGQGLQILQNKTIYQGHFMNGLRHGSNGYYVDTKENEYFGEWKLGIMHGKGFLKTRESIYYGIFVNWLKHGQGEEKFVDGDSYKGEFQNSRFDGFGVYRWANDTATYQGSFKNGFRHGKGKWSQNETKYIGNYVQGLKEGYGELYFPSGNFYKGNFVNDKRQAYGEMFWTDGSFYKGEWKNGIQNGKGQIYLTGNEIMSGIFENSILVQVTPPAFERQFQDAEIQLDYAPHQEPRGIIGAKNRTYSQSKGFNYNKRLARIDESVRKPQHSVVKSKMYFRSPQRSDHSLSKGRQHNTTAHDHHHGHTHAHGRECKCMKRLENFRLKQQVRSIKVNDSRMNNGNV